MIGVANAMTEEERQVAAANLDAALGKMDYENFHQEQAARLGYQQELAIAALKALFLANGGAIIALFTFIGAAGAHFHAQSVWWGFVWFVVGLSSDIVAYLGGYFSQAYFMNMAIYQAGNAQRRAAWMVQDLDPTRFERIGNRWLTVAISAAVLSLAFFCIGSGTVLSGVLG